MQSSTCGVCGEAEMDVDFSWVQCDLCDQWHPFVCVGLEQLTEAGATAMGDYFCPDHETHSD